MQIIAVSTHYTVGKLHSHQIGVNGRPNNRPTALLADCTVSRPDPLCLKHFFFKLADPDMKNFGNSVAESKLGAEGGHYLLFPIVQGAHHSLSTLENFQYPRVYMQKENRKSITFKSIPNLKTCTGINSVEVIDFGYMTFHPMQYQPLPFQSLAISSYCIFNLLHLRHILILANYC